MSKINCCWLAGWLWCDDMEQQDVCIQTYGRATDSKAPAMVLTVFFREQSKVIVSKRIIYTGSYSCCIAVIIMLLWFIFHDFLFWCIFVFYHTQRMYNTKCQIVSYVYHIQ